MVVSTLLVDRLGLVERVCRGKLANHMLESLVEESHNSDAVANQVDIMVAPRTGILEKEGMAMEMVKGESRIS